MQLLFISTWVDYILVSSPDLIQRVYRLQYNRVWYWKWSALGLVLGLGPRLIMYIPSRVVHHASARKTSFYPRSHLASYFWTVSDRKLGEGLGARLGSKHTIHGVRWTSGECQRENSSARWPGFSDLVTTGFYFLHVLTDLIGPISSSSLSSGHGGEP